MKINTVFSAFAGAIASVGVATAGPIDNSSVDYVPDDNKGNIEQASFSSGEYPSLFTGIDAGKVVFLSPDTMPQPPRQDGFGLTEDSASGNSFEENMAEEMFGKGYSKGDIDELQMAMNGPRVRIKEYEEPFEDKVKRGLLNLLFGPVEQPKSRKDNNQDYDQGPGFQ